MLEQPKAVGGRHPGAGVWRDVRDNVARSHDQWWVVAGAATRKRVSPGIPLETSGLEPPKHALDPQHDPLSRAYNDVPYVSAPDPARHPDRLATIGTLLGLDVAPISSCRVLEFACGDGSNLVPIAATLPNASFVGFDFAARPLARAQAMVRDLGLRNVQLLNVDLRELPGDLGRFDYIIAHGLYSWLPDDVRDHLMPAIARHLAPRGVAFVNYNTMPGCHMRAVVWDMLRHHTRAIADAPAKVAAARALLKLVAAPLENDNTTQQALRAEMQSAAAASDAGLMHDDLAPFNAAVYFHEFAADAVRAGLTYLAEAHLGTMLAGDVAPDVRLALGRLDRLAREQYLDFIHFRRFRESLLCHGDAPTRFVVDPSRVLGLHVVASLALRRANAQPGASHPDFVAIRERLLAQWPRSVAVSDLARWLDERAPRSADRTSIEALVMELYVADLVDLRSAPVQVAARAGERPEAFAAARWLSRDRDVIPSVYHEALRYQDPLGRKLLALLDGTHTRDELTAALGGPFAGSGGRAQLDRALDVLASKALLVR